MIWCTRRHASDSSCPVLAQLPSFAPIIEGLRPLAGSRWCCCSFMCSRRSPPAVHSSTIQGAASQGRELQLLPPIPPVSKRRWHARLFHALKQLGNVWMAQNALSESEIASATDLAAAHGGPRRVRLISSLSPLLPQQTNQAR